MTDPNPAVTTREFSFTDFGGDDLYLTADDDTVLIETTDEVVLKRKDVRALAVWLHKWLGDIEVTSLDQPPGSAWLPGPNSGTP